MGDRPPLRWRLYFWSLLALSLIGSLVSSAPLVPWVADAAMTVLGLVGVFGFAHHVRIGSRRLWRFAAWALPTWDASLLALSLFVFLPGRDGFQPPLIFFPVAALLALPVIGPAYLALFRYGYRCERLWDPARVEAEPLLQRP